MVIIKFKIRHGLHFIALWTEDRVVTLNKKQVGKGGWPLAQRWRFQSESLRCHLLKELFCNNTFNPILCIHTQFRIQQGNIACLYPTRDATLSRFIPNSGPKVCTPLTNNDMCICTSLSIFQQSWNLSLHLLIKTAREAISTTPLYVLQDCNRYSAILKPLFLSHI